MTANRWDKIQQLNFSQNKADKNGNRKQKTLLEKIEGYHIIKTVYIYEEYITMIKLYIPNNIASKYIKNCTEKQTNPPQ